jgi:DNA-binding NarL/FixJ family response regulator
MAEGREAGTPRVGVRRVSFMRALVESSLAAGRAALVRAAWSEARKEFASVLALEETVEALEGMGVAARWQMDGPAALEAHERAYRLARESGDAVASARLAIELVFDCVQFRGAAEMSGWLERAGHLLERLPPQPEHAVLVYLRANRALNGEHDPAEARRLAGEGVGAAEAVGSLDLEMLCRALEGLALVAAGSVREGMRLLDAATTAAVGGEVATVRIVEVICCHLIDACQRVRDLDRAGEWCVRVEEISHRYADAEMFATCRTHYADILLWRGEWREAEETLGAACRELGGVPRKVVEGVVRLAELRRRQGRPDQAEALLAQAEGHRMALLVRAALRLDREDALGAAEEAERFLRRVGNADHFERVPALELLVRARLRLGDRAAAHEAVDELERTAAEGGTSSLRAVALVARSRSNAEAAPEEARHALEDAVELFAACGARYEAAQAQLELARLLRRLDRGADADVAGATARAALAELGAPSPPPERSLLTAREQEVLRLLARGHSNDAIASELFVSVRTVERHVENLYRKIGVSGRTARAAATAWALAHGMA